MMRPYGSGEEYQPVIDEYESPSLPYNGDQTESWTIPHIESEYDIYEEMRAQLVLPSDVKGMIQELCVRFDYTLPDGSTGSIDSDPFIYCLGNYVDYESSYADSERLTATFRIDDSLVSPAAVNVESAEMWFDGRLIDLSPYTAILEGGAIYISCAPSDILEAGESFTAGEEYDIFIELSCPVLGTEWNCGDWCSVTYQGLAGAPSVTIDHVYAWNELNVPGGLRRGEVAYSVEANEATDITTSVTVSYGSASMSFGNNTGEGSFVMNRLLDDGFLYTSSGWHTEVEISYIVDGTSYTDTVETDAVSMFKPQLEMTMTRLTYLDEELQLAGTITLRQPEGDPNYSYTATLSGARAAWVTPAEPYPTGAPIDMETIYFDDDTLSEGSTSYSLNLKPPDDATAFILSFEADAEGHDGTNDYEYFGGLSCEYRADIPGSGALGDFLMSVYVTDEQGTVTGGVLSASGTVVYEFDPAAGYTSDSVQPTSLRVNWFDSVYEPLGEDYIDITWGTPTEGSGSFTFYFDFDVTAPAYAAYFTVTVWDDTIVQQATSDGFADINT